MLLLWHTAAGAKVHSMLSCVSPDFFSFIPSLTTPSLPFPYWLLLQTEQLRKGLGDCRVSFLSTYSWTPGDLFLLYATLLTVSSGVQLLLKTPHQLFLLVPWIT